MSAGEMPVRRSLRADAEDNRRRLITAARAVFAERGLDAPLDDVARRAGVGNATLYRRFPSRAELVAAAFDERLEEYAAAAEEALQSPDPWAGLCDYLERLCEMQAADRGAANVLLSTFPIGGQASAPAERAARAFEQLVVRAKAAGQLRGDFVVEDVIVLMLANVGVVSGAGDLAPLALRRLLGLVLEGCRGGGAVPLPEPPSPDGLRAVLAGQFVATAPPLAGHKH